MTSKHLNLHLLSHPHGHSFVQAGKGKVHITTRESDSTLCGRSTDATHALSTRVVDLSTLCGKCVQSLFTYRQGVAYDVEEVSA